MPGFTQLEIALLEKLLELKTELDSDKGEVQTGYRCSECGRTLSKSSAKVITNHEKSKYHLERVGTGIDIDFSEMGKK